MIRAVCLSIALLALLGCSTKSKLVGKWNGTLEGATVKLEFKSDGKYSCLIAQERDGGLQSDGTYKVDGNSVTLHPETITNSAGTMPAADASLGKEMRYTIDQTGERSMALRRDQETMQLQKE